PVSLMGARSNPPVPPLSGGRTTSFQRKSGGSDLPGPLSNPGTMTVSNSRPLALWMVMICRSSSPAATSGSAEGGVGRGWGEPWGLALWAAYTSWMSTRDIWRSYVATPRGGTQMRSPEVRHDILPRSRHDLF